ncbi:MAG: Coenzyme F420 hydrogenase/dehydrogenase, beta subunit C-terminal domain [Promethearchaeota archaeon]
MKSLSQNIGSGNSVNKPTNIGCVVENDLCVGCGVCEAACPNKAIEVIFNTEGGMPIPRVNAEKCNGCQKCLDVCYGHEVDHALNFRIFGRMPPSVVGNFKRCYIGYANDQTLRYIATSGGVVTALLTYALEQGLIDGAIVTKMEAGNPPIPKAFVASTVGEIVSSLGSKYCPVSLAECLNTLKTGKRYAVIGLPCHIYGTRKLVEFNPRIRNSILFYFGILCGGMPSYFGTSYILKRCNIEKHYITKFEYRGGGWPGRLLIRGKKQTPDREIEIRIPYPDYWRGTYQFFFPLRCTLCHDGFNEFSDVSFGDVWLSNFTKNENNGLSVIIARTDAGERLIQEALQKNYIQVNTIAVQDVTRSQQGLIRFKFSTLRARINLFKKLGRKLPTFDLSRTPPANFDSYFSAIGLYLGKTLASKKNLWWIFDIYVSLYSLATIARNYAKMLRLRLLRLAISRCS